MEDAPKIGPEVVGCFLYGTTKPEPKPPCCRGGFAHPTEAACSLFTPEHKEMKIHSSCPCACEIQSLLGSFPIPRHRHPLSQAQRDFSCHFLSEQQEATSESFTVVTWCEPGHGNLKINKSQRMPGTPAFLHVLQLALLLPNAPYFRRIGGI